MKKIKLSQNEDISIRWNGDFFFTSLTIFFYCISFATSCAHRPETSASYENASAEEISKFVSVSLPFAEGTRFKISQGAFGCCTHNLKGYEYAWDFDVPFGTEVLAAEGGKVIQVWEPKTKGGCDPKLSEAAHNIKIRHADGTIAQYVHIERKVKIGDEIEKGQIIAVTADNGYICKPQLHFNLFRDELHLPENGRPQTIPVSFDDLPGKIAKQGYEGVVPNKFAPPLIVTLSKEFASFWSKAKGKSFDEQKIIWDRDIESPHQSFYDEVVWRKTNRPDWPLFKDRTLKAMLGAYPSHASAIEDTFQRLPEKIRSTIFAFRKYLPDAQFKSPIYIALSPVFDGKSAVLLKDSRQTPILALGVDNIVVGHDNVDLLLAHELFHVYHAETCGILEDGYMQGSKLTLPLWAEGMATYTSSLITGIKDPGQLLLSNDLGKINPKELPWLASEFLKAANQLTVSQDKISPFKQWFNIGVPLLKPSIPNRSGYFLGYNLVLRIAKAHSFSEMAHWKQNEIHTRVVEELHLLESSK